MKTKFNTTICYYIKLMTDLYKNLPDDIIYYILSFNDSYTSILPLVNKECNKIFNKEKFVKCANKIKRWYKTYTYTEDYEHHSGRDWGSLPKKFIIQYYRKYYPIEYLMEYPDFMAKKLHRNDLHEYINNIMSPKSGRKKIEIIKFLNLPSISENDIVHTGW
jgi:hypothetical protein